MGGLFRDCPDHHAYAFDGDDFDGRAFLDQPAFTDNIHTPVADQRGAGGTQLREGDAGWMQEIGLLGANLTHDSFRDEDAAETAIGKNPGPDAKAADQTDYDA